MIFKLLEQKNLQIQTLIKCMEKNGHVKQVLNSTGEIEQWTLA